MTSVGVGVVGAGLMGRTFAAIATQLPHARLVGVCDIREAEAQRAGASLGVASYADYRELVQRADVDAIIIATPEDAHLAPALAAAECRKHIFIEKPLASTVADGEQIIAAAAAADLKLMVGHVLRFDTRYARAQIAVAGGAIGDIVHMHARRTTSVGDMRRLGGRTSLSMYLGVHDLDVLLWLARCPVRSVFSRSAQRLSSGPAGEDSILSILTFADGAVACLENSWLRPNGPSSSSGAEFTVVGTQGMIQVTPYAPGLAIMTDQHVAPYDGLYNLEASLTSGTITGVYRDELEHFITCVARGTQPLVRGEDGLAAVRVAQAIDESARIRAEVSL